MVGWTRARRHRLSNPRGPLQFVTNFQQLLCAVRAGVARAYALEPALGKLLPRLIVAQQVTKLGNHRRRVANREIILPGAE